MTIHHLKTTPNFFADVRSGAKPFEIRFNDRAFAVGDVLVLHEYDNTKPGVLPAERDAWYSGQQEVRRVTYVLPLDSRGAVGYVALGMVKHYLPAAPDQVRCGSVLYEDVGLDSTPMKPVPEGIALNGMACSLPYEHDGMSCDYSLPIRMCACPFSCTREDVEAGANLCVDCRGADDCSIHKPGHLFTPKKENPDASP